MTEPTIGEEGIEAAAKALSYPQTWVAMSLTEQRLAEDKARAAITAYLATQGAPDEERLRAALDCACTLLATADDTYSESFVESFQDSSEFALNFYNEYVDRFNAALTPPDDGTGQ